MGTGREVNWHWEGEEDGGDGRGSGFLRCAADEHTGSCCPWVLDAGYMIWMDGYLGMILLTVFWLCA